VTQLPFVHSCPSAQQLEPQVIPAIQAQAEPFQVCPAGHVGGGATHVPAEHDWPLTQQLEPQVSPAVQTQAEPFHA
jgi:hypothetical protein